MVLSRKRLGNYRCMELHVTQKTEEVTITVFVVSMWFLRSRCSSDVAGFLRWCLLALVYLHIEPIHLASVGTL